MKCVRCGAEISEKDRCCLKCGAINYSNPLNKDYAVKYADEGELVKVNKDLLKERKKGFLKLMIYLASAIVAVLIILKFIGAI